MKKTYRHGEILFVETKKIPKEAKKVETDILLVGSGQNAHKFKGGQLYELKENDLIFGYFKAKNTKLYHKEHGEKKVGEVLECKLPDGIYELRVGQEFINNELKQIID